MQWNGEALEGNLSRCGNTQHGLLARERQKLISNLLNLLIRFFRIRMQYYQNFCRQVGRLIETIAQPLSYCVEYSQSIGEERRDRIVEKRFPHFLSLYKLVSWRFVISGQ